MTAINLTKKDFEEKVLKADKPVLVDYWAPGCGPCRLAGPVIDELSGEYEGKAIVAKVNVDEEQELAGKYCIMSIPTVIIFKNGKEVDRQVGFPGKEAYQALLDKYIK